MPQLAAGAEPAARQEVLPRPTVTPPTYGQAMTGRLPSLPVTADERRALATIRRDIDRRGWTTGEGCVIIGDDHVATDYSVGFTRHHGHPEIVIVGGSYAESRRLIAQLAHEVACGAVFEPCLLEVDRQSPRGGASRRPAFDRFALLTVDDPQHLWLAHLLYARDGVPVTALQLVAPDEHGLFPWEGGAGSDLLLGAWTY